MTHHLKAPDFLAASAPIVGTLTLSEWNSLAGLIGAVLGVCYLLWKWHREARSK